MHRIAVFFWGLSLSLGASANLSANALALMRRNDCFGCHSINGRGMAPSFVEVAKRYRGKKGIVAVLVKKVKWGGSGNWGSMPMASHPDLSDEQLTAMVKWVLKQK